MLRFSLFLLFLLPIIAFMGCGSDEVELPLSAFDGAPTTHCSGKSVSIPPVDLYYRKRTLLHHNSL